MRGTVLFRLLKAKQDLTRMPYVPETMHIFHYTCHYACGRGLQEELHKFHGKFEMETAIKYNNNNNMGKTTTTLVIFK
jgi:hypothetical protein